MTLLALGARAETADLPHLEIDARLDPVARQLEVTATLAAGPGQQPVHWQLTPEARVDADERTLPPSPAARSRTVRYRLALARTPDLSHRDTLSATAATADPGGSFLPGASLWHPSPADGSAFTYRVTLTVPAGQRALVPGRLQTESEDAREYRAVFDFPHPADSIDLMAGPYTVEERVLSAPAGMRLRTYFHPELRALARDYLDAAEAFLRRYDQEIGPYPYTEFSIVSSPTPTGFGMPTLTYLGIDVLKLPFIRHTSLGHEVLHNWWGNGVRVDYDSGNWCEGLTTFMADYAYKEQQGADAALPARLAWLRDLAAVAPAQGATLRKFTARTHGASQIVGYNKAAMLFLMLRDRLGEETFREALRQFWRQHRFRQASWMDIQHAFERVSGESLSRLFDETLDSATLPAPVVVDARMLDDRRVRVTLHQPEPPALMRVPLRLRGAFGVHDVSVELGEREGSFDLPIPGPAETVVLDPEMRLLRRLSEGEQPPILRQVMVAPRVRLQLADEDATLRTLGGKLADSLLDNAPEADAEARLLIGSHAGIDRLLDGLGLQRPPALGRRGSAQAWADRTPAGTPVLVVSVLDAAALQALLRPLPHYGGQGYLVFEGAKAIDRGQWPAQPPVTAVTPAGR